MNFLQLCNELIGEYGLNDDTALTAVTGQSGEAANVVRWIRNADLYVSNLWQDWKFLWFTHSETFSSGREPPLPTFNVRQWHRHQFWLNKNSAQHTRRLPFVTWDEFEPIYDRGVIRTEQPAVISERPNRTLVTNTNVDRSYTFSGQGWRRPTELTANTDTPLMPAEFHMIIVYRAAIDYGDKEDAPEIVSGAETKYMDVLEKLQSSELEGFRYDRMAMQDELLSVEVPGTDADVLEGYPHRLPTTR